MKLAVLLGKSLQEVKQMTTSCEFVRWRHYQELEWSTSSRQDWYLARIAKEIYTVLWKSSDKNKVKVNEFLLEFSTKKQEEITPEKEQKIVEQKVKRSKSFWSTFLGSLSKNKKDKEDVTYTG